MSYDPHLSLFMVGVIPSLIALKLLGKKKRTMFRDAQLGRHKGGRELLAAVGFCDELRAEAGGKRDSTAGPSPAETARAAEPIAPRGDGGEVQNGARGERKDWLVLEGTVGPNGKPIAAVGEAQLKILRAAREEVREMQHRGDTFAK